MSRFRIAMTVLAVFCAMSLHSLPAAADELQDISILYKKGQPDKALERLEAYLTTRPKDAQGAKIAQARFLKGLILAEQNRTAEAIKVYQGLIEDYPELPEPYNNLAVLYASQNQFDKAKMALETAINTHPSYATAHENLGDVYAKMASQAYDKALQLDKANAAAQTKLSLVKELFSNSGKPNRAPAKAPGQLSAPAPVVAPAPVAGSTPPSSVVVPAPAAKPATESAKPEAQKPEAKGEQPKPPVQKEKQPENGQDGAAAVTRTLHDWAKAWSAKNVAGYLAFYAKDFKPGKESRASWEKSRKDRISRPKSIHVAVESPRVTLQDAEHASVTFRQIYRSDALQTSTQKTLVLAKIGDKWLIQQERVGR